jgi:CO/xanthine dehydrogenase FAD-binding subunit
MKIETYVKPTSLEDAYKILLQHEDNAIMGGGAWLKLTNKKIRELIDISGLELDTFQTTKDAFIIGAQATLRQLETSVFLQEYAHGILANAAKSIMGVNIRNIATIGGSIMGKYSFSDIITPLLALDATLLFHHKDPMKLSDFMAEKHHDKDILVGVALPLPEPVGFFHNVKKTAIDFAVINIAIVKNKDIRIVVGARPGGAIFAEQAMRYINDQIEITTAVIEETALIASSEIPVSDNARASKEYRELLVKVYVKRGLMEVFGL